MAVVLLVFVVVVVAIVIVEKNETDFSVKQKNLAILFPVLSGKCTTESFLDPFYFLNQVDRPF